MIDSETATLETEGYTHFPGEAVVTTPLSIVGTIDVPPSSGGGHDVNLGQEQEVTVEDSLIEGM